MPAIFNALPGLEVPVGSISKSLAKMWADTAASGGPAPASDDTKATQVNFVLHLGLNTTIDDAVVQFRTAVSFSHRYPSRVVVLCPLGDDTGAAEIRAKVYGECFLGKAKGDTRCCEFVILSYPRAAREFLENQVSICLSTDLPLYYWAHRFTESVKLADYRYLLTRARRVLLDSAIAPADALTFAWPQPEAVRDLVYARLLPIRQSLGQFLSRYPMPALVDGLKTVSPPRRACCSRGCATASANAEKRSPNSNWSRRPKPRRRPLCSISSTTGRNRSRGAAMSARAPRCSSPISVRAAPNCTPP